MLIRQGDLTLRRVGAAPPGAVRPTTLAVGEESGHSHVADGYLAGDRFVAPAPTTLRVEGMPWRHRPVPVPAGEYEIVHQRELTEDEEIEEVRRVAD